MGCCSSTESKGVKRNQVAPEQPNESTSSRKYGSTRRPSNLPHENQGTQTPHHDIFELYKRGVKRNQVAPEQPNESSRKYGSAHRPSNLPYENQGTQTPHHDIFELYKRGSIAAGSQSPPLIKAQTPRAENVKKTTPQRQDVCTSPLEPFDFGKKCQADDDNEIQVVRIVDAPSREQEALSKYEEIKQHVYAKIFSDSPMEPEDAAERLSVHTMQSMMSLPGQADGIPALPIESFTKVAIAATEPVQSDATCIQEEQDGEATTLPENAIELDDNSIPAESVQPFPVKEAAAPTDSAGACTNLAAEETNLQAVDVVSNDQAVTSPASHTEPVGEAGPVKEPLAVAEDSNIAPDASPEETKSEAPCSEETNLQAVDAVSNDQATINPASLEEPVGEAVPAEEPQAAAEDSNIAPDAGPEETKTEGPCSEESNLEAVDPVSNDQALTNPVSHAEPVGEAIPAEEPQASVEDSNITPDASPDETKTEAPCSEETNLQAVDAVSNDQAVTSPASHTEPVGEAVPAEEPQAVVEDSNIAPGASPEETKTKAPCSEEANLQAVDAVSNDQAANSHAEPVGEAVPAEEPQAAVEDSNIAQDANPEETKTEVPCSKETNLQAADAVSNDQAVNSHAEPVGEAIPAEEPQAVVEDSNIAPGASPEETKTKAPCSEEANLQAVDAVSNDQAANSHAEPVGEAVPAEEPQAAVEDSNIAQDASPEETKTEAPCSEEANLQAVDAVSNDQAVTNPVSHTEPVGEAVPAEEPQAAAENSKIAPDASPEESRTDAPCGKDQPATSEIKTESENVEGSLHGASCPAGMRTSSLTASEGDAKGAEKPASSTADAVAASNEQEGKTINSNEDQCKNQEASVLENQEGAAREAAMLVNEVGAPVSAEGAAGTAEDNPGMDPGAASCKKEENSDSAKEAAKEREEGVEEGVQTELSDYWESFDREGPAACTCACESCNERDYFDDDDAFMEPETVVARLTISDKEVTEVNGVVEMTYEDVSEHSMGSGISREMDEDRYTLHAWGSVDECEIDQKVYLVTEIGDDGEVLDQGTQEPAQCPECEPTEGAIRNEEPAADTAGEDANGEGTVVAQVAQDSRNENEVSTMEQTEEQSESSNRNQA